MTLLAQPVRTPDRARPLRVTGAAAAGVGIVVLLAAVHLTQGTAAVGAGDVWAWATGSAAAQAAAG
ncbi:MAG: hypothetical protein L0I24_19650, partial [Pseudonocardia sp.]|nr:hypothetical protein [Pseudonocardia sp.]